MNRTERRRVVATPAERQAAEGRKRAILIAAVAIPAILIIVAIVLFNNRSVQSAAVPPALSTIKVGRAAPTFAVSTTSGLFDLARAGDKPTLLEVFATWCPHCQRMTQTLDKLHAKYGSRINLIAVSGASPRNIRQHIRSPSIPISTSRTSISRADTPRSSSSGKMAPLPAFAMARFPRPISQRR
jgi:thiol-disulfide isomerase/thioredoxin